MTQDNRFPYQLINEMEEWEMYNTSNRTITSGMSCSTSGKPNDELSREKATICRPLPNFSPCSDSGVPKGKSLTTYDEYGSLYEDRSRKRKSQYPEDPVPDASVTVPDHGNSGPSWCYGNSAKLWACDYCNSATFHTYHEALIHEKSCCMRENKSRILATTDKSNKRSYGGAESGTRSTSVVRFLFASSKDVDSLSDRQCYVRSNFVEVFTATARDVASRHSRGAQKLFEHQIGIRCIYCSTTASTTSDSDNNLVTRRGERAVCYPSSISRIYQTVADMCRFHFPVCSFIPPEIQETYSKTKTTRPRGVGSPQQYWIDSAKELGLVDTDQGIRYKSPASSPPLSTDGLSAPSASLPAHLPYDHSNAGTVTTDDTNSHHSTSPSLIGSPLCSPTNQQITPPQPKTSNDQTLHSRQKITRNTTSGEQKVELNEASMLLLLRNIPPEKNEVSY
jgi:hypothetical protein